MSIGASPPASPLWRTFALLAHAGDVIGVRPRASGRGSRAASAPGEVLAETERLEEALWTAGALTAALDSGLLAALERPLTSAEAAAQAGWPEPFAGAVLDVLVSLGLAVREEVGQEGRVRASPGLAALTAANALVRLDAALRAPRLQVEDFTRRARERSLDLEGWRFTDPEVIEAQGELTIAMAERALPKLRFLPGLLARLEAPGARLLDVGAGAAGLSIALCRHFPSLSALALEPAPGPAAIADAKIAEAGLGARIELRRQRVEELEEEGFDLVFLPQMFIADAVIDEAAERVFRATRPGGWLLAAVLGRGGDGRAAAVARLRNLLWGGNARTDAEVQELLQRTGYRPVIRSPGRETIRMICARRPPA